MVNTSVHYGHNMDYMKKYTYDKLTITAQAYDRKISVEYPQDLGMVELLELFKSIAVGLTFSEDMWKEAILRLAEEYEDNNINEVT